MIHSKSAGPERKPFISEFAFHPQSPITSDLGRATTALVFAPLPIRWAEKITNQPLLSGVLPEPFDILQHSTNTTLTFMYVGLAAIGLQLWGRGRSMTKNTFNTTRRAVAAAAGGITIAANLYGEVVGYGPESSADPADFAFGLFGGLLAWHYSKPKLDTSTPTNQPVRGSRKNKRNN